MDILKHHPRYNELCTIYGELPATLEKTANKQEDGIDPGSLEARIVKFTFCMVTESGVVEKSKELPCSMDIYQTKGVVGRIFGIRPLGCKLILESEEPDDPSQEDWSCDEMEQDKGEDDKKSGNNSNDPNLDADPAKNIHELNPLPAPKTIREEELLDSTRKLNYYISVKTAHVRVELR